MILYRIIKIENIGKKKKKKKNNTKISRCGSFRSLRLNEIKLSKQEITGIIFAVGF